MNIFSPLQKKEPVTSATHVTEDEVIESDWAVVGELSQDQSQRRTWPREHFRQKVLLVQRP